MLILWIFAFINTSWLKIWRIKLLNIEPFQITDYSKFSSENYIISFEFVNSNTVISSFDPNVYVVVDELKNFTIKFSDVEGDNVLLNIASPGSLHAYAHIYQSNSTYLLIVQADQDANTLTSIVLTYTDFYHQDAIFWQSITMNVNIFASEPPKYATSLQNVTISACDWVNITLPTATDLDGDSFTTSFGYSVPDWIKLIDSGTLHVCPSQSNIQKGTPSQPVDIVLRDTTGAYTNNTFYVNLDTSMLVEFPAMKDISVYYSKQYSAKLDIQNAKDVHLVDCTSSQAIEWSSYNSTSKILIINANIELIGKHWAKIQAIDGWSNNKNSESFNIIIKSKKPPVFLSAISPIILMKGQQKIIEYK